VSDIWKFVPTENDDDPIEEPSAEEGAMHTESLDRDPMPAHDAGRAEVALSDQADDPAVAPMDHLADEESEYFEAPPDADHEADVQEVLEQQHYVLGESDEA